MSNRQWPSVLARILLVVVGGYAAAAGCVAGLSAALTLTGMERSDAVVLASMLGFLVYLVLLLWGFTERRLWRLGLCLALWIGAGFGFARLIGL
ncbi:hypothetical protein [Nitrospira sp. KM1]|uniref:hypothetical protein n=1 Tax=Nitrospira sp. KM1 TaxID=1936990 RepID=UPI001564F183|nr:hypothetical protein [Nitrospira sp. KM1]